jgi:hypothetical protein
LRHLDALPRVLRWAVFLPAGLLCMLIVQGVLDTIYNAAGLPRSPASIGGVTRVALVAFTWALGVTLFPATLSPRPWAVGVVMFAVALVVGLAPIYTMITTPYLRARMPSVALAISASIGGHVLGGGVGLYLIRRLAARTNDHPGNEIPDRA